MRVFLDANVLFTAAHNPDGLASLLLDLGRHQVLTLISSSLAIEEARVNLQIKTPDHIQAFIRLTARIDVVDTPSVSAPLAGLPANDQLIFGAALAARATQLLTGDRKHFGPHFDAPERTNGVTIQTVRAFFTARFGLQPA